MPLMWVNLFHAGAVWIRWEVSVRCLLMQRNYQDVMEEVCNWLPLLTGSHEQSQLVFSSLYVNHMKLSLCDDFTACRYEEEVFCILAPKP